MTGQQISSAIRISKKFHEKVTIVWGGIHPTICPESVLAETYVDDIIRGDGEGAFYELLQKLDLSGRESIFKKKSADNYRIHCMDNLNESVIDFSEESIPEQYFIVRDGFKKAFPLETSRGCPHNCAFCHNSILGHSYRVVETARIVENINQLSGLYHVDGVIFQEDNFFLNEKRVVDILKRLRGYDIGWKANSRLSYFKKLVHNKEIMKLICDSNCHVLQFGLESGSNRILRLINKGISVEEIIQTNQFLSEYDIAIRYNFIIGFPTESMQEIEQTLGLIDKLLRDNPHMETPFVNIYTPYPGTPLYELAKKEGFSPPVDLNGWSEIVWNSPSGTLHDDAMGKFLREVSNDFLKRSLYPR